MLRFAVSSIKQQFHEEFFSGKFQHKRTVAQRRVCVAAKLTFRAFANMFGWLPLFWSYLAPVCKIVCVCALIECSRTKKLIDAFILSFGIVHGFWLHSDGLSIHVIHISRLLPVSCT